MPSQSGDGLLRRSLSDTELEEAKQWSWFYDDAPTVAEVEELEQKLRGAMKGEQR